MTLNSISEEDKKDFYFFFPLLFFVGFWAPLTSGEEPVGVLDDGLDDADDLQGNGGHHLRDVAAAKMEEKRGDNTLS